MKTDDNHFRGFPALWNAAAFYLFLLQPSPWLATLAMAALIVLKFVPIHVLHPVRVVRFRKFNFALIAIWAVLTIVAVLKDFNVSAAVSGALCAIGIYVVFGDAFIRLFGVAKA
jgi:phosphatidylcholine synthase